MSKAKIVLGQRVKDKVSDFTGIATARVIYLNGCEQILVTPKVDEKGSVIKNNWIDEIQLEIVDRGILPEIDKTYTPKQKRVYRVTYGGEREHPNS